MKYIVRLILLLLCDWALGYYCFRISDHHVRHFSSLADVIFDFSSLQEVQANWTYTKVQIILIQC